MVTVVFGEAFRDVLDKEKANTRGDTMLSGQL